MLSELQANIIKKTFLKSEYFVLDRATNEMTYVYENNKLTLNLVERSVRLNKSEERIRLSDLRLSDGVLEKLKSNLASIFIRHNINIRK